MPYTEMESIKPEEGVLWSYVFQKQRGLFLDEREVFEKKHGLFIVNLEEPLEENELKEELTLRMLMNEVYDEAFRLSNDIALLIPNFQVEEDYKKLAHILFHCNNILKPMEKKEGYDEHDEDVNYLSRQQLAYLAQEVQGHASEKWKNFGKFLGVVAVVVVVGGLACTPFGGVTLVGYLALMAGPAAMTAVNTALAGVLTTGVGVSVAVVGGAALATGGLFAHRKGQETGFAKKVSEVYAAVPGEIREGGFVDPNNDGGSEQTADEAGSVDEDDIKAWATDFVQQSGKSCRP